MPFINIQKGLTLKVPTRSTTNWDDELRTETFDKISEHDHSGNGKGLQIQTAGLADNAVTDVKLRLRNNQWLKARNAANDADVNILRIGADNKPEISGGSLHSAKTFTLTNNQSSAADVTDLIFDSAKVLGSEIEYHIFRDADSDLSESGRLHLKFNGSSWDFSQEKEGLAGITFSVTSGGQVQYTSSDLAGHTESKIYFFSSTLGV